ncbi:hypothetical protein POM88_006449 [Heracleum sosnowskyi]|uniref:Retrovirus-related Pol polyprotein from transposon TNT 1-94-like beta-barrel domain-containing protein n=1 Tax=Heracleum sosnowskyi TaxID=360622 RepID=A0AAD8N5G9_9APIA|nr:hypothetical protein POM88_006449 [Heracleum sosnowskyi]
MNDAKEIWDDFAIRFAQTNVPKLFNSRKEIASLSQGNLSISTYFTKFRALNDELDALSAVPHYDCGKCTCAVNVKLDNFSKSTKLSQFLMGLGEQYTAIRGHLLLMNHVPSLSAAYSILMQEENQREFGNSSIITEYVALAVQGGNTEFTGGYKTSRQPGQQTVGFAKRSVSDASLICEVCHLTGHSKDKCFCVYGYPSWHRLFGKPKPKPKSQIRISHAHNVIADTPTSESKSPAEAAGFTTAQCQQIMTMIHSGFKELSAANSSSASGSNQWNSTSITPSHMAGNVLHFVCHTNSKKSLSSNMWILDSGATDHITPHLHLLTNVNQINYVFHLPNGQHTTVTHIGTIILHVNIVLTDVLYVPSFNYNLLSIPKLTSTNSCNVFLLKMLVIYRTIS